MSGQSQDPANTDYGLGTGTGTGGIGHELGTSGLDTGGHGRTGHGHGYGTRHGFRGRPKSYCPSRLRGWMKCPSGLMMGWI